MNDPCFGMLLETLFQIDHRIPVHPPGLIGFRFSAVDIGVSGTIDDIIGRMFGQIGL